MWKNPARPTWDKDLLFEPGGMAFKLVVADASEEEIPTLKGAPHWEVVRHASIRKECNINWKSILQVIAQQEDNGVPIFEQNPNVLRNNHTSTVRLLQLDFAIRDVRAPVGWVFGTFMYDGTRTDRDVCLFHS